MNKINKFLALLVSTIFITVPEVFAEKTSVDNLYQYNLDNGLTVFEAENHAVPLVYIEIAVKTGAKAQTPETAGLFHLYEHMMFKGNALYKDATEVQAALSELGVTNWNGTTGVDCVNYFFTIPSDRLEDGLAFWNAAVRSPLMDKREFENEKKVVLSEITGDLSSPGHIYMNNIYNILFPDAPYRLSAGGSTPVIKDATIAQLLDIKDTYYIPSNAALFIGGDINPEETYELVKKIWGSWSGNGQANPKPQAQLNTNPLNKPTAMIMPYDQISPQVANVTVMFRGPDTDYAIEDTYAADYFCQLAGDPESIYVQDLYADTELMIPGQEYIWQSYQTVCQSGTIQFGATMLSPESNLPQRSMKMLSDIQNGILPKMAEEKSLYTKSKAEKITQYIKDQDAITADTATGLLTNLRFWWIATSPEYYYSYSNKISQVTQKDMQNFVAKYFTNKNALVTVLVNPQVYEATKEEYEKAGFIVADSTKAAWWDNPKHTPDSEKIAQVNKKYQSANTTVAGKDIYKPEPVSERKRVSMKSISDGIKKTTLKNGIPVYIKKDETKKISTVQIVAKGGLSHLSPETSGLEDALFTIMGSSSENYDFNTRQVMHFQTNASISASCKSTGSILSLNVLNSYFDKMLPVLVDGFLNPKYEEQFYKNMMTSYENEVHSTLNDPQTLLSYTAVSDIYKNHPYEANVFVTPDSIKNLTVQNMKKLHSLILDPSNLIVVAVGNIDEGKFIDFLNKNIGRIHLTTLGHVPAKEIPPLKIKESEPTILTHESSRGTGFVVRVFEAPSNTVLEEYIPACIASDIYSDIMYSVVRDSHGICYTPYSYTVGSKAPVGIEFLVNLSNYEDFTYSMDTARQLMAYGMIINGTNPGGSYSFRPIENVLESYKNKLINSTYSSQATTSSIASTISISLMHYNDLTCNDKQIEQIRNTTAQQVKDVFKKYWVDSPARWYVIVGPEDKDKLLFK